MLGETYPIRTDLALEAKERIGSEEGLVNGVDFDEKQRDNGVVVSTVRILTKNAQKAMGRPKGCYITIEAPDMIENDEGYHRNISMELAKNIQTLIPQMAKKDAKELSVLIVGLGNRAVTPDALGPRVVDNMFITRHILKEYGKYAFGNEQVNKISGIVPGVMAQTGMECLEIVRGVVKETNPDLVIAVDALAARNTKRLCRTIQLTDTGITPGSGIGNHRDALNKESVGVPVISIGVPTVVDAATIVNDTMHTLLGELQQSEELCSISNSLANLNAMFVTPKDIDESIRRLSFTISEGLNIALSKNE